MKNWRIIFILLMFPPFLWGAAKTPPTRNEILAKLYAATHRREAKPVESVRIVLSGKLKIEYLRKGNRSLLREDGKVTILYDGRRCWSNGTIGGNDATWIFQFLFALRPVPELFGNLKLFPEPDGDTWYAARAARSLPDHGADRGKPGDGTLGVAIGFA